jgi:hypothetical protein
MAFTAPAYRSMTVSLGVTVTGVRLVLVEVPRAIERRRTGVFPEAVRRTAVVPPARVRPLGVERTTLAAIARMAVAAITRAGELVRLLALARPVPLLVLRRAAVMRALTEFGAVLANATFRGRRLLGRFGMASRTLTFSGTPAYARTVLAELLVGRSGPAGRLLVVLGALAVR